MFFESFIRCKLGNTINTTVYSINKRGIFFYISPSPLFLQVFVNDVFFSDRIFFSANAHFVLFSAINNWISIFSQSFLNSPLKLDPLSVQTFSGFLLLDHFLNASTASFAYKAFIGCTRTYRDHTSTATSKYLTPLLCWATLSICAISTDQISFIRYATAFNLGKVSLNCSYFV